MEDLRAKFKAAREGDQSAKAVLMRFATEGHPDAEGLLLEEIREAQLSNNLSFSETFARVAAANPDLHRAYLNANGA